jgi:hypothetical protein
MSRGKKLAIFIPLGLLAVLVIAGALSGGNQDKGQASQSLPTGATSSSTSATSTSASAAPTTATSSTATSATTLATSSTASVAPKPAAAKPATYTGRGDRVIKIKKPETGAALVKIANRGGSSNFVVQDAAEEQLLVNTIGPYSGTVLLDKEDGQNTTKLKVQSDGSWSITVSPLLSAPQFTSKSSGKGDAVVVYTGSAGTITMTHSGKENFVVTAYGGDGSQDLLVNEIGRYNGQNTVNDGPVLLEINADGAWTLAVTPD